MECQGKMLRAVKRKAESTDVHVCGGLPCSSVEVSVMAVSYTHLTLPTKA